MEAAIACRVRSVLYFICGVAIAKEHWDFGGLQRSGHVGSPILAWVLRRCLYGLVPSDGLANFLPAKS